MIGWSPSGSTEGKDEAVHKTKNGKNQVGESAIELDESPQPGNEQGLAGTPVGNDEGGSPDSSTAGCKIGLQSTINPEP